MLRVRRGVNEGKMVKESRDVRAFRTEFASV